MNAGGSEGGVKYGTGRRRRGPWQRMLDLLNERGVQYNYDGFASMDRAEAAVAALRAVEIPARATLTDAGPVVLVVSRFRRRAEPVIAPFQSDL